MRTSRKRRVPAEKAVKRVALLPVTERGMKLAERIFAIFPDARLYHPEEIRDGRLKAVVRKAFGAFDGLVFVGASGIAVRAVAPLLRSKGTDPAVVVMDEAGRFVVSLLSGHLGGANLLAREIASITKATPVITTATDIAGLPCVEDIAWRFSLAIEDIKKIKRINSAILNGGPVSIIDKNPARLKAIRKALLAHKGIFRFDRVLRIRPGTRGYLYVTVRSGIDLPEGVEGITMFLRPAEFVAGIGCRRGVVRGEIKRALEGVFSMAGLSLLSIRNLATIDIKRSEKGLVAFAEREGLGMEFFSAADLNKRCPKKRGSAFVMDKTGARGVSEPAALISSGAKRLWIKKKKTQKVTVAVARAPYTS